ncbi:MAG: thermonuclease family protein [Pseudomonadota bacterium]
MSKLWPLIFAAVFVVVSAVSLVHGFAAPHVMEANQTVIEVRTGSYPICGSERRVTCIVDGDTFWLNGTKYRIAGLDTPEVNAPCTRGRITSARATERLQQLMSNATLQLAVTGVDRYGRALVAVWSNNALVTDVMISDGVAVRWTGRRHKWC